MVRFLFIISISLQAFAITLPVRDELSRFTLLHDRVLVGRRWKQPNPQQFLQTHIHYSSGLKSLIGKVKDATDDSKSSAQKTTDITNLLNQNVNSERFVDFTLQAGVPLPYFKIKGLHFLPQFFTNLDAGASLSIDNQNDPTSPRLSNYLKMDTKVGFQSIVKTKSNKQYNVALYYLARKDAQNNSTAAEIATSKKVIDFSALNQEEKTLRIDIDYTWMKGDFFYGIYIQELKLSSLNKGTVANYKTRPLFNPEVQYRPQNWKKFQAVFGWHFRRRYDVFDGLYTGVKYQFETLPLSFSNLIDSEFITLNPIIRVGRIHLSYSLKSPYRNPNKNIWVPAIHALHFGITI